MYHLPWSSVHVNGEQAGSGLPPPDSDPWQHKNWFRKKRMLPALEQCSRRW